jgi:hypothetical protein
MTEPVLTCPECGSDRVTTEHHQMFMVNGGAWTTAHAVGPIFTLMLPATHLAWSKGFYTNWIAARKQGANHD